MFHKNNGWYHYAWDDKLRNKTDIMSLRSFLCKRLFIALVAKNWLFRKFFTQILYLSDHLYLLLHYDSMLVLFKKNYCMVLY